MGAGEIDFSNREALDGSVSDNGAVTLAWAEPNASAVELQHARSAGFKDPQVRYRGTDAGSVLTGLPEGEHYFRIGAAGSDPDRWSPPLKVTVTFFPRAHLFLLLGIGGLVVVATIAAIVTGHFRTRKEESAP